MFVMKRIILGSLFVLLGTLSLDGLARNNLPDFTSLVTDASPAVVNITATRKDPALLENNQEEVPEPYHRKLTDLHSKNRR